MTTATKNDTIVIDGIEELDKKIKQLSTDNPGFEKRLRGVIRKVLGEVRAALQKNAQSGLQMNSDPRKAYKAVRYAVYKRLFGGQVNILQPRKTSGNRTSYQPPRKGLPKRGGNRRKRSTRTEAIDSYEGKDRGFILRFLNAGTRVRYAGYGRNGETEEDYERFIYNHDGRGNRGSIGARNWFGPRSQAELENAAGRIQQIIDRVINDEFV